MSFVLVNTTTGAVVLDDLGITVPASSTLDITDMSPTEISMSGATTGDLGIAIAAGDILIEDPRAGYAGNLSLADSLTAALAANDSHIGIQLAQLGDLDNVVATTPANDEVLQYNSVSGDYELVSPSTLASSIAIGDLSDVDDLAAHTSNAPVIFMGDGSNYDTVSLIGGTSITGVAVSGTSLTFNVDDDFISNQGGDTFGDTTSGTWTVASGSNITIAIGATLTIADAPVNAIDAVNKSYVDSVAAGLDPKESVRGGTLIDISGTYTASGGTGGTGAFTAVDLTSDAIFDGVPTTPGAYVVGDRILIKNQADAKQNGIYVVTNDGATGAIERASDQNGSPANEVSSGNFTFIELGTTLASSGWVTTGDGILTLNTDDINWVQFSESSDFSAGDGLALTGSVFSMDINNMTAAPIALGDEIAFNDVTGNTPQNTTVQNMLNDLDIPYGLTGTGLVVQTADDTYIKRAIAVDGAGSLDGLSIANADGTGGDPTVGLDINGMVVGPSVEPIDAADKLAVFNVSTGNNMFYTVNEIANSGAANAFGIISDGTGTAIANSPSDVVTINGDGIAVAASDSGTDAIVDFALDISDLTLIGAGTVVDTNIIAIDDGTATNKQVTLAQAFLDLEVPNTIGSGVGFIVSDGSGAYTTRTITVAGVGLGDGLAITNGDGTTSNVILELDIDGSPPAGEEMAATDEFIGNNADATANEKFTGQEIADGVSTILNLPSGLTVTTIDTEEVLTLIDTTRANKVLSVETTAITWSENRLGNNDWVQIGNANDANVGYIVPLKATIVKISAHTTNNNAIAKTIDLYVDGTIVGGAGTGIVTFPGAAGQASYRNVTLNLDVAQDSKIQLRGGPTDGAIEDTVITIWLKWDGTP